MLKQCGSFSFLFGMDTFQGRYGNLSVLHLLHPLARTYASVKKAIESGRDGLTMKSIEHVASRWKILTLLASAAMVAAMAFPVLSYGEPEGAAESAPTIEEETFEPSAPETYVTVRYNEHYVHDVDGNPSDAGTRLLGERAFPATVGETVDAWDYVAQIPGFFFWDGWPGKLTVSENPDDNVIELFYMRLSVSTYTVNYYAMTGADLTVDDWTGALSTDPSFHFLGSSTYTGQLYDKLVDGEEYAVEIEDAYAVGAFPDSIRLTLDPSDNVINVLYVPKLEAGPEDIEIEEKPETVEPDDGEEAVPPENGGEVEMPPTDGGNGMLPPAGEPPAGFPPIDVIAPGGGSDGEVEITDEMIDNAPTPGQAQAMKDAYNSGLRDGGELAKTGDGTATAVAVLLGLALVSAGVLGYVAWRRRRD